ncbi:MAG: repair protein RecN [Pseudonocardiales bacterium]|nr:repair protein RecN [Pseudonocardiales bacterium]
MLEELRIRGIGVIDDAVLPLGPGLTAVTGETGAGKTMVVTGLLLLFGGRADSARVRTGAEQASVDGRLEISDPVVAARVRDAGGDMDDDRGLVLRRVVSAAGRSRAYVGGAPAPVAVLGELAERLLTVHGQSDQLRLTRRSEQIAALDRFGDIDAAPYAEAYTRWRGASGRLAERTARAGELRREADLLSHGLAEIEAADPQPAEDAELTALATRLAHADALRLAAHAGHDTLVGDNDDLGGDVADVASLLAAAHRALGQQAGADPELDELTRRLDELAALVTELGADLGAYTDRLDADPARLAEIEARRAVLGGLVRKYGDGRGDVESVLAWAGQARDRLGDLDVSDEAIALLTEERDAAAAGAARLARELTSARASAAAKLADAVTTELAGLAMADAALYIEVRPRPTGGSAHPLPAAGGGAGGEVGAGPDGCDDVEFLLQPHPQSPALPLGRGASGGELSRVMLALEVCLAGSDPVPTMVFDEVDAGVGGRAAVEVGRRLAQLARNRQVIVVTHLPQVAAYADRQIVVDKPSDTAHNSVTASDVRIVTDDDRIAELARMLAGSDSAAARKHATELLATAADHRGAPARARKPRKGSKTAR